MPSALGKALTEAHRKGQAKLSARVLADLMAVWPMLDPADLDATSAAWLTAAAAVVNSHRANSAALAREYLRQYRAVETGKPLASWEPPAIDPLPAAQVKTSLLVTGPVSIKAAMARGIQLPSAVSTALAASMAAGSRQALSGGRATVMGASQGDSLAVGVQRVTSAGSCDYCSGLGGKVLPQGVTDFHTHDGCHCQPALVY